MAYFNFYYLLNKYNTTFSYTYSADGTFNSKGDYVKGTSATQTLSGAIIAMREDRVIRSEGTYSTRDKVLYISAPLTNALNNAKVTHDGKEYSVEQITDNGGFTGCYRYVLKYVSTFGG